MPGQLHESLKASSPNEKPFSPTVVKPHARKLAKASRRSCERPGKNERTFEQPPYVSLQVGVHQSWNEKVVVKSLATFSSTLHCLAEMNTCCCAQVLNLPESGDNVWHNLHWIVPATARLYGKAKTSLGVRAPRDVLLILLFDAYEFREDDQQANLTEVRCKCFRCNGTNWFFIIIIRFTMFLYVLGMWQQLLLDRNHSAQEKRAARRLPSFIRHCRSSTSSSGWLGTAFKGNSCLEAFFRYPFV